MGVSQMTWSRFRALFLNPMFFLFEAGNEIAAQEAKNDDFFTNKLIRDEEAINKKY